MKTWNKINNNLSFAKFSYHETTISASDINNMFATPIEVIPAPGANKGILLCRIFTYYKFNTTAATGGGNIIYVFASDNTTNAYGGIMLAGFVLTSASSSLRKYSGTTNSKASSVINNSAINITNLTGAFTGGDCTYKMMFYYMVVDLV